MIMQVRSYRWFIIAITTGVFLQGCMQSSALPDTQRPTNWGVAVDKHYNFYRVNSWLYRSEQPSSELLADLQQQQIDIVINLRVHNEDRQLLQSTHIQLFHIPINTWDIQRQDILKVMQILQAAKSEHKKVLIHCYHGSDRTGAMVAMSRILLENWSVNDAVNEMKHGGYGFHPIWMNINWLFKSENIDWMRQQLAHPTQ
ncbi:protein tyrosine phosphatase [Acinetobacter sp. ANC 4633]|uniref:dual specificity protein phosphatase family protein n=1 Tax=Acinetobacter sp. ANC 4633 TaxID=2529845 RepID=UPI0010405CF9|nr:dual specificity protein phosphatase family protein [Acinetobacter sp. ANC 4633]TCB26311.1 protein tyrosine phosphatase [Acinetobacter sp. ANC 4633]